MGVTDKRFGAELITKKGKIYKFDDLHCLSEFAKGKSVKNEDIQAMYLVDYHEPHGFIELQKAVLFKSELFRSPMGSNIAAFTTDQQLKTATQSIQGSMVHLDSLISSLK
jgi:copper chaperone NosL